MRLADLHATFLGEVDVPSEHREAIDIARRQRFHALAPLAAVHSLLNAVILTFAFWGHAGMPLVFVWCYTSAVLVFLRLREARRPAGKLDGRIDDARIVRYTLLSGALWGAMIAVLIASSGAEHALLLGVFTAAILCVGELLHSSFPMASLGYSLLIATGAAAGMALGGHPWFFNASLLLAASVMALQRFAAANDAADVRRHLAAAAMQEAKETAALLLQDFEAHSADWLWRIDSHGRLGKVSQRFIKATGLNEELLEGGSFVALFAPESGEQLQELLRLGHPFHDEAFRVTVGGREAWWSLSGQPTIDGGWRGVCSDITRSRDAEARIAYVTEYDSLTDLPNRAMLVRQLEVAQDAAEQSDESFALFVIDLDNFKALNDTQGHPAGDAYLKVVAQRLRDCVGQSAFLARLGGDEFAILQRDMMATDAGELAELIVDALLAPVTLNGKEILAGGSVGVALAPENGTDPAILMKNAELAPISKPISVVRSPPKQWTSTSSPWSTRAPARSPGMRRSCAGIAQATGSSHPPSSSPAQKKRVSSCRSASG